jgi:Mycobacterium membrane protein
LLVRQNRTSKGIRVSGFSAGKVMRQRWAAIVAVVVVAVVGFSIYRLQGIFGSDNVVQKTGAEALENTGFDPKEVLLEVFGSPGSVATINYLDQDAQPKRVDDTALPWSTTLTTDEPTMFADLRAQGDGGSIGCRITVDGVVKDERSTDNVNGYISCLDKTA